MVFTNKRVKRLSDRMKSLNPKRIAAVVGGAALLATGLAFAGPISFQNVPIISNSGQPLVQIVVGTLAKPSDGVAAANIAAAIGNLAYTSVPVTASVNTTQAAKVLHAVIPSSAKYSLTNQQVYFNESTTAYISGTYSFSALIGSVFNRGVTTKQYGATKTPQDASQYGYSSSSLISPPGESMASPYTNYGSVPFDEFITPGISGGGVSFSSLTSNGLANIMRITSADLPALSVPSSPNGEQQVLWLTGVPVFDQGVNGNVNQFNATNVGGAYQAVFNSPIPVKTSSNTINNAAITILGQPWTIINYTMPTGTVSSTSTVAGGKLELATSLLPEKTIYVGQNYSTGTSNNFTVQVADIGQPNSSGVSPAALKVYYNGVLYNTTAVKPGVTKEFNDTGHTLYVHIYQTFAGLYAYEKYAKIQMYSNVMNVSNGAEFNSTYDKGWTANLLWTNASSTAGTPNELQSIIILNTSPSYLLPGQSFDFINSPKAYKLTFEQPSFGSGTYNPLTLTTSKMGSVTYDNGLGTPTNIKEPVQALTVSAPSSLSDAFDVGGVPSSSVMYNLMPYEFSPATNTVGANSVTVSLTYADSLFQDSVSPSNPVEVQVQGLTSPSNTLTTIGTALFDSGSVTSNTLPISGNVIEITNLTLINYPVFGLSATATANAGSSPTATLDQQTPEAMYIPAGKTNYTLTTEAAQFNQANGQRPTFFLSEVSPHEVGTSGVYELYNYSMGEYPVPFNTTSYDNFTVGLVNSTDGGFAAAFDLNYTSVISGSIQHNNVTYTTNTQGVNRAMAVKQGFYSEKGSEVASISPGAVTINFASGVDMLNFVVSPYNVTAVTKSFKTVGPVGIGQPVPNVPNVTVASVTANISVSDVSGATVTGISNLTATPSVSSATTPVLLKNLTTSPLVVLNSTANPSSNLILIGSGFVNGLSAQVQAANNVTFTSSSAPVLQAFGSNRVLIAGYYANQTTAEANAFIQDLYASASTS